MRHEQVEPSEDAGALVPPTTDTITPSGVTRTNEIDTGSSLSSLGALPTAGEALSTSGSVPPTFLRELAAAPAASPARRDLAGQTLGRYRVRGRLGRGAMGIVYDAKDLVLRRDVALKVLPDHLVRDPARRRRFLREAQSGAIAAHPHIAAVYDVVEQSDLVFIAMERVQGRTLREVILDAQRGPSKGALPAARVFRYGKQIAGGLARAHEAGVVHRDLKPENLMVAPGDDIKILDFGIAKLLAGSPGSSLDSCSGLPPNKPGAPSPGDADALLTGEGQLLGTPCYMAPEQARGQPIDGRSDIFSLGVVLYELATGARPFPGSTIPEVLASMDRGAPAPAHERNPEVPEALSRVIARCLQKSAGDRYRDCHEVEEALKSAEAPGRPSVAPPGKKRRALWPLVAIAPVLAAGLIAGRASNSNPAPPPSPAPAAAPIAIASPLAAPGAVLACPPLEAEGVDAPEGWLGAAAASMMCRRARVILGGSPGHVAVPAQLLGLPRQPGDEFPRDPYGEASARPKAIAAAQSSGTAYLDGRAVKESNGFRVSVSLKDPTGRELTHSEGRGASLHQAVMISMAPLLEAGAIPRAAAVDPDVAKWTGVKEIGLLLDMTDWELAYDAGVGREAIEARLETRKAEIAPEWEGFKLWNASMTGEGWSAIAAPPVDRTSAPMFARTAPIHATLDPAANAAALADEAHGLAAAEPSSAGKAALSLAEAQLRGRAGDGARALALAVAVLADNPVPAAWNTVLPLAEAQTTGPSSLLTAGRAFAAWMPESPNGYNEIFVADAFKDDPSARLRMIRRAHVLSPGIALYAVHESMNLIHEGRREQARAIAAELVSAGAPRTGEPTTDPRLVAGEYVLAEVEANEGRFGAATARARRVLFAQKKFGRLDADDLYMLTLLLDVSMLLGNVSEVAEELVQTFIDPEPPRLYPGRFVAPRVAQACAFAPRPTAKRCFSRLRGLLASNYFREELMPTAAQFIDGAEAYSQGDYAAAAAAWRPLSERPGTAGRNLIPDALDRAGKAELAERIDARSLDMGPFNGIGLADVRAARRALAAGDRLRAEKLARRIVDAWSSTDVPVPAVDEMLALLGRKKRASRM